MKRKIVKQGAATLMISLPSKWCKKFGLKKGDEVDIETANDSLLVSPKEIKVKSEVDKGSTFSVIIPIRSYIEE